MTIIAYRDGEMVGDGRVTSVKGYIDNETDQKVYKLADGSLLGVAGNAIGCNTLVKIMQEVAKEKKPRLPTVKLPKTYAIHVATSGTISYYESGFWEELKGREYYALGAGDIVAMSAMDVGATAKEAAQLAVKRNIFCGGRLRTVKL